MKQIDGDLLDYFSHGHDMAIAHVCNCQGVMGSGIAFAIKNRFPCAYDSYKQYEVDNKLMLGSISVAWPFFTNNNRCIVNLHAQMNYGTEKKLYLDYDALRKCLVYTQEYLLRNKIASIGLPYKMGSDRAGGDWNIVTQIITESLDMLDVTIVKL